MTFHSSLLKWVDSFWGSGFCHQLFMHFDGKKAEPSPLPHTPSETKAENLVAPDVRSAVFFFFVSSDACQENMSVQHVNFREEVSFKTSTTGALGTLTSTTSDKVAQTSLRLLGPYIRRWMSGKWNFPLSTAYCRKENAFGTLCYSLNSLKSSLIWLFIPSQQDGKLTKKVIIMKQSLHSQL